MPKAPNRSHKYFWLDQAKITRAQKALGAKTEAETIERALDFAIAEAESGRLTHTANQRSLKPFPSSTPPADTASPAR
jgi:hypothetical protein